MKFDVLQLNPILVPAINDALNARYTMHRLFEQDDKDAYIREHGASIRGVITGGHTGISNDMIDRLPELQVIAVNGVGTDAVHLNYARSRGLPVTATFGALTEDVADLAIGLILTVLHEICPGNDFVKTGKWVGKSEPKCNSVVAPFQRQTRGHRRHGQGGTRDCVACRRIRLSDRLYRCAQHG